MQEHEVEIRVVSSLRDIDAADWDACACPEAVTAARPNDPFTTYRFLRAVEDSGSVGTGTGWQPQYLTARIAGQLIGVAPMYAKSHSQGEYIFDHNWAHAYERAGGRYYPKLQIAVPHTPATGRRFLLRPGFEETGMAALVQGAVQLATNNRVSSLHATFCTEEEALRAENLGMMVRKTQQFHWLNDDYTDFDSFLESLSSRKRKNIRKERAGAQGFGGTIHTFTGDTLQPEHWDAFWQFYQDTGARKWGTPYLTRAFFDIAQETLRDDMALVLAERNGRWVAGALNFIGAKSLYGRYWGCVEH
ncbi:MAG: GNAT family N-acetyltransferase, partial [Roseobacter sp.]